jgi:glycosyltransferase involved in cell wall biosynthesis
MRVTLVISSLGGGGAERVLTTLANYWVEQGHQVTIISIADDAGDVEYPIDSRVTVRQLSLRASSHTLRDAVGANVGRLRALRAAVRDSRPDGVIAFMTENNILTRFATLGLRKPVIVSERVIYRRPTIPRFWRWLRPVAYRLSTALVLQTDDSIEQVPKLLHSKVRVIPNPVPPGPRRVVRDQSTQHTLIAMGRLSGEKGFDLLLESFAKIAPKHPDWSLTIYGEGRLHDDLLAQRDSLGLRDRVNFPGPTRQPRERMAESDLFVLSSRHEGFPNALCEAMATGVPVVSFACDYGPRSIIRDGIDGVLVPNENVDALAVALDRLMSDPAERDRLGNAAVEIVDRFSLPRVAAQWEALISGR